MKFKFYPTESIIYDFINFPKLAQDNEPVLEDHDYNDLLDDEYLNFINHVEVMLQPYVKEIELFYPKKSLDYYAFYIYITKSNSFFGYDSIEAYLDYLQSLDEYQIKKSIICTLLRLLETKDIVPSTYESILSNKENIMAFIKELPTDSAAKWNLYLIMDEPIKYRDQYIDLMYRLLPMFYKLYEPYKDKVMSYGKYLEDYLNKNGEKGLVDITFSMFDPNILEQETKSFLVSLIDSYTLAIVTSKEFEYFIWGLKMEEFFKSAKELNENKQNERIQIFKNLGDKTRYEVLKLIASGEFSTKKIATALEVSSATITYHLNALLTSKIIKLDKGSNRIGYIVDYDMLKEAVDGLMKDLRNE